jgi:hypothetical protein
MLRRRIEVKTEVVLGEDHFGLRSKKITTETIWVLRITSERTLEIDEELCACFADWRMHLAV